VLIQLLDVELACGFIWPSPSESSAPMFFVTDPPSESRNKGNLQLVVDYRPLNSKIELDEYPIPPIRSVMSGLPMAKIATKFGVRSGFSNIRMAPGSEAATAFKTPYGLFGCQVMPMARHRSFGVPAVHHRLSRPSWISPRSRTWTLSPASRRTRSSTPAVWSKSWRPSPLRTSIASRRNVSVG